MLFNYKYSGSSKVSSGTNDVGISFAPDTYREPTFFVGKLNKHLAFREAMSALHHIVVSDYRYQAKERSDYKEWLKEMEPLWLAEEITKQGALREQLDKKREELKALRSQKGKILSPFYKAQQTYFDFLRKKDRDAWWVLDPVITVNPDELFFECFSQDESSYGKLSCGYEVFKEVNEFSCGTTNIDYSQNLYNEFQKIRTYKETDFTIDPSGFEVTTGQDETFKEVKIDLPDSWVRGFLQVSSAMTLPARTFHLHPLDMHNFLFLLKRNKEKEGPRSIRFILKPGEPVRAVFEPWNKEVICGRSIYKGEPDEIRIWGRRRLLLLERLLPVVDHFKVTLLGTGLPSFYEAKIQDMVFTLGLSGWTANDWTRVGNFDLMAPRGEVDGATQQRIYLALKENWAESSQSLSKRLGISEPQISSALTAFIQAGKVVYDLNKGLYRIRELSKDDLPVDALRFNSEADQKAFELIRNGKVALGSTEQNQKGFIVFGKISDNKEYNTQVTIDRDERLIDGNCTCSKYKKHRMFEGPCEHMVALKKRFDTEN